MENNHKLCLYVSYYLARFNNLGLKNLGYHNWDNAFTDVSRKLHVNYHSVKNWRDEFDPIFEHRAGWHQRAMSPSRIRVVEALENLDEPQIRDIVKDILNGEIPEHSDTEDLLLSLVTEERQENSEKKYIVRGPTGRKAEEFFLAYFDKNKEPVNGTLEDRRDLGCGYDFKIVSGSEDFYIEVKGLAEISGGVLLSDKEWRTALEAGDNYYLCIIRNVSELPSIRFIQNPGERLNPKKNIYSTIQINWTVPEAQL